jgi:hypothetical protein
MRAQLAWVVRVVIVPVLVGAGVVWTGTLGYVLFWPGLYRTVGGHLYPVLLTAALVGAISGLALGLCRAADPVVNQRPARRRRLARRGSLAAQHRDLRRPARYGRDRRRLPRLPLSTAGLPRAGG